MEFPCHYQTFCEVENLDSGAIQTGKLEMENKWKILYPTSQVQKGLYL